uniref:Uncharacterized protein n=1 Tax=Rhizophora mucronata TaxID=61149 RepID=A0A2P2N7S0_RHIMU
MEERRIMSLSCDKDAEIFGNSIKQVEGELELINGNQR